MIVYKFGGASVSSASSIKSLAGIVKECKEELFIVISAFGKTTNNLEALLSLWYKNSDKRFSVYNDIVGYHYNIISKLFPSVNHHVYDVFSELTLNIERRLHDVPGDNYDFEYDQLVSYGELISTRIVSAFLETSGLKNQWADARSWLKTDDTFREGKVNYIQTELNIKELVRTRNSNIYVTQGFIGGTADGHTTTLGREGSDYTAAIIASMLDAVKLVVWKDVPGILTADPLFFPEAEKLDFISYREAIELSFYGAKVIHPKTIKPLQNKNIPLYVKSFLDPGGSGTLIQGPESQSPIRPIVIIKREQILVSLTPRDFSFVVEDCLSRIFALFFKYNVKVNLIQHSAISFTLCFDNKGPFVMRLLEELGIEFRVLYNEDLELITIRHYTQDAIKKHSTGRKLIVEQRSRTTAMLVVS